MIHLDAKILNGKTQIKTLKLFFRFLVTHFYSENCNFYKSKMFHFHFYENENDSLNITMGVALTG